MVLDEATVVRSGERQSMRRQKARYPTSVHTGSPSKWAFMRKEEMGGRWLGGTPVKD